MLQDTFFQHVLLAIYYPCTCLQVGGILKKAWGDALVSKEITSGIVTDHCHSAVKAGIIPPLPATIAG
jgi:hypothetical protein